MNDIYFKARQMALDQHMLADANKVIARSKMHSHSILHNAISLIHRTTAIQILATIDIMKITNGELK